MKLQMPYPSNERNDIRLAEFAEYQPLLTLFEKDNQYLIIFIHPIITTVLF